jgi:hypothetical protein
MKNYELEDENINISNDVNPHFKSSNIAALHLIILVSCLAPLAASKVRSNLQ